VSVRKYHAFVRGIKKSHGLTQREAQHAYRAVKEKLGKSPGAVDIKRHSQIVLRASNASKKAIPKAAREKIRRIEAITAKVRAEDARRKVEAAIRKERRAAPARRRADRGGEAGTGGEAVRAPTPEQWAKAHPEYYDEDYGEDDGRYDYYEDGDDY
jgi:hypothetical protein